MIKEMKKNNKMVLALVVIAALAMVSIAGIALHSSDDSSAAGTYWKMGTDNTLIIDEKSGSDFKLYVPEGTAVSAVCPIVITDGADYSGTLSIGTLTADLEYTQYAAIQFTDASSANLTAVIYNSDGSNAPTTGGPIAMFMIGDSAIGVNDATNPVTAPGGSYNLIQGQVILGSATEKTNWNNITLSSITNFATLQAVFNVPSEVPTFVPFDGKITAGSLTVTSSYVVGAIVSLASDGSARISGYAASPVELKGVDSKGVPLQGALTLDGKASIQYPEVIQTAVALNGGNLSTEFYTDSVDVTVAAGAVITAGDVVPTIAQSVTITTADDVDYAWLIDSNNNKTYQGDTSTSGSVTFKGVPFGNYNLVMIDSGYVYYNGTATVSATSVAISTISAQSNVVADDVAFTADATDTTGATLNYDANTWTPSYVFDLTDGLLGVRGQAVAGAAGSGILTGVITFPGTVSSAADVLVIASDRTTPGKAVCYVGPIDGSDNAFAGFVSVVNSSKFTTSPASGQVVSPGTVVVSPSVVVFGMKDSNLIVYGTMNFLYNSADNYGYLDISTASGSSTILNLEKYGGLITQGVSPMMDTPNQLEDPVYHIFGAGDRLSAAYYVDTTKDNLGNITKATYYFTSINNAMKNDISNIIYLTGYIVLTEDTTLSDPNFDTTTVILTDGSTLKVGDGDATPILTIPGSTDFIIQNPTNTQGDYAYEVVSGQAVYDTQPVGNDVPIADVLIIKTKYIYTDLATALDDIATQSGDVVEVIRDGGANPLQRDATVNTGVTLNDNSDTNLNGGITIPDSTTLTVKGTLNSVCYVNVEDNGTLVINGTANISDVSEVNNAGTINVQPGGTLNLTDSSELSVPAGSVGALNVDGTVNIKSTGNNTVSDLAVGTGTVTIVSPSTLAVTVSLKVGVMPTISTKVSDTAVINGKIAIGDAATATVYGKPSMDMTTVLTSTNGVIYTTYVIYTDPYVTLYTDANAAQKLTMLDDTTSNLLDITITNWYNNKQVTGTLSALRDPITGVLNAHTIGETDWTIVYAEWTAKTYTILLTQTNGVNWEAHSADSSWSNTTASGNNNGAGTFQIQYGTVIWVTANPMAGYSGTPVITVGSENTTFVPFTNGTSFTVDHNATFKVTADSVSPGTGGSTDNGGSSSGNNSTSWSDPMVILLIIVIIIIAIIAIVVAVRLLRS